MSDSNLRKQSIASDKQRRVTLAAPYGKEELAISTPSQRNWRGILIALLVIVAVLGLILCAIMMLMPLDDGPRVKGELFSIGSVNNSQFSPTLFNGTWMGDGQLIYMDQHGGIAVMCVSNLTTKQLMTNLTFRQINAEDYRVSSDLNFVLLMTDIVPIWTHSYKARHHIYDVSTQEALPLTLADLDPWEIPFLEAVTFTPTGSGVAFVYNNDIYYKPFVKKSHQFRVTNDGEVGTVFYGRPDFLYETRVLETGKAMWFSPDSQMLLFAGFNTTLVGENFFPYYGNKAYAELASVRIPKPGTNNPQAQLYIADLQRPKFLTVKPVSPPPVYLKENDFYLTGVQWIANRTFSVTWMNRRQNRTSVCMCRATDGVCQEVHTQVSKSHWVNPIPNPIFDKNRTCFVTILPMPEGDHGSLGDFLQVWQVNTTSRKFKPITYGTMTVVEVLAWDLENHFVYFLAAVEPGKRLLFKTGDTEIPHLLECLTCPLEETNVTSSNSPNFSNVSHSTDEVANTTKGEDQSPRSLNCAYAKAYFSSLHNPKYYILDCLGPDVPVTVLVDVSKNTIVITLNTNAQLRELFDSMAKPQIKTLQVEIESGYHAQVRLYLPPGLREHEDLTFPLILHVDSRPGSQLVTEKFHVDWLWYLAGKRNFIIAEIDGRGTGCQGEKMIRELFYRLGTVEVEDQIAVVTYLRSALRYIDPQRIAVYGHSHGGYVSTMILSKDKDNIFKCGVAVNPVSSFSLTDSFFTERYMGMPNSSDNFSGYADAALSKRAAHLKDKDFLLISSTANLLVPFHHTAHLVNALVKEGVQYKHQIYPDVGDDLSPVANHYHSLVDAFWDECFKPLDFYDWETMGSFTPFSKD